MSCPETSFTYLQLILEKYGYKITHARYGEEAIQKYHQNNCSLILMDLKLPGMNGWEATKQIRAMDKEIPIIVQTSFASKLDRDKAKKIRYSDSIAKPIKRNQLIQMIKTHMDD